MWKTIVSRLTQPSTWAGFAGVIISAQAALVATSQLDEPLQTYVIIAVCLSGICGTVAILLGEKSASVSNDSVDGGESNP